MDKLRAQLAFALPFAGAMVLYVGQRYFVQYAVSLRFDAATFALFSVAAFHLPVVDIIYSPASEVMIVQLGRAAALGGAVGRTRVYTEWDQTVRRLAAILFPATACAFLFGPTILPLLFTEKYARAVPLFLVSSLEIPLWALPLEAVCRAFGDTKFLFGFNFARVVIGAASVLTGIRVGGLPGAILGAIVAEALARSMLMLRVRKHVIAGSPDGALLSWAALGRIAVHAAVWMLPILALRPLLPHGRPALVTEMLVYLGGYLLTQARADQRAQSQMAMKLAPTSAAPPTMTQRQPLPDT
jgi:O-antigen/teichoic acid export membrane protein